MYRLQAILLIDLAGLATVATKDTHPVEDLEALTGALGADDACSTPLAGGTPSCALSELQVRAGSVQAGGDHAGRRTAALDLPVASASLAEATGSLSQNGTAEGNTSITGAVTYDASCYGSAGSKTCGTASSPGKCVCATGCMGADGNCYPSKNKVVAKGFVLKNMRWPDQKIYVQRVSVFGQLKTTSFSSTYNLGQDKFTLYELPGLYEGKRMFFLASQKWPTYVVSIRATKGTALSLWGTYAVSLTQSHEPWQLRDMMMQVCSLRTLGQPDAVKIGTSVPVGGSSIWAYIKSGTWFVYGYWYPERVVVQKVEQHLAPEQEIPHPEAETPGTGGYWIPDPPIPRGVLPDC